MVIDHQEAQTILESVWGDVLNQERNDPEVRFIENEDCRKKIDRAINHAQVTYRFCLPTQLLGKLVSPDVDCLSLQKGDGSESSSWDARSLASKVIAPFNQRQESILGTSQDPYVSKPMRQPKMFRDDPSKKDRQGWNDLVDILQETQNKNNPEYTLLVFKQAVLSMIRRQRTLNFAYDIPIRISLDDCLGLIRRFLDDRSGGDRALSVAGALFEVIGQRFHLYKEVSRGQINTSDVSAEMVADLECVNEMGHVVFAVEVKDRRLTLADMEGTLKKARGRSVTEIFFTGPGIMPVHDHEIAERISRSFSAGQNAYVFDLFDLARSVLALGGETFRTDFLKKIGEHLDNWNTQPANRQAWQRLLAGL